MDRRAARGHPEPSRRTRAHRRRAGERDRAHLGCAAGLRLHAAAPLGAGRVAGDTGPGGGGPGVGLRFLRAAGKGRRPAERADQLDDRSAHGRQRLHRAPCPVPGARERHDGHGTAAQVRRPVIRDPARRPLADPHGRGARDEHSPGRDPARGHAAAEVRGVFAVLPERGRRGRQGHAGNAPRPPVRQGGAGTLRASRSRERRPWRN